MHALVDKVSEQLSDLVGNHAIQVALSGGIDSVVLLHILCQIQASNTIATTATSNTQVSCHSPLSAIHVNHGISPNAETWAAFCTKLCAACNVPLQVCQHSITKFGGESLENNARQVRYQEFYASKAPIIALAHQQDDQIETMLSQILRGSDLHNIAAMRTITYKQGKTLWRPLLDVSRQEIELYAKEFKLDYICDESNLDTTYLRNFVRHEVLPLCKLRDNTVGIKLLNVVSDLQGTLMLIDEVAREDLAVVTVVIANSSIPYIVVDELRKFSPPRQLNLLAVYIKEHNLPLPSKKQLVEFVKQALTAAWDKRPMLQLDAMHALIRDKAVITISNIA